MVLNHTSCQGGVVVRRPNKEGLGTKDAIKSPALGFLYYQKQLVNK